MICSRFIVGWIFLFTIQSGFSQNGTTAKVDSRTTIDFPVKPDSSVIEGKLWLVAKDSGCTYELIRTLVKDSDPGFSYQGLAYSSYLEGLNKTEGLTIIKQEDFEIKGLEAKYFYYKVVNPKISSALAKARVFYFDGILYAWSCTSSDTDNFSTLPATKFLESFKINTNAPITLSDTDSADLYTKFRLGHLVFSAVFAVIAFALYLIWKKRGTERGLQRWF